MHPGRVLATLVLIRRVYPPLARHDSLAEEVPNHSWHVQARLVDQVHQLRHLTSILWPVCPPDPLLGDVADVAKRGAARLLPDIEPPLVPLSERGVPSAAKIPVLHPVTEIEVYSTCNLRASNCSFVPQAE